MKKTNINLTTLATIIVTLFLNTISLNACTIVSGIASNGHVWNANNEDGPFRVANFINVFPKNQNLKYGYYTLSYLSPNYGQTANLQGGMNEAGLTFDFNALNYINDFDESSKKTFPKGNDAILTHILGNMKSVEEVISFFNMFWFTDGFRSAQMHVADSNGRFAIISASGIQLVKKGEPLVSTNFDICAKKDATSCWRYPIAYNKIKTLGASFSTMKVICKETAQKNGATMYSNIQNLTTGDIWFFSKHDPNKIVKININKILLKGQKSYSFNDLKSLTEEKFYTWNKPTKIELPEAIFNNYVGSYINDFTGEIIIKKVNEGLQLSFANGEKIVLFPSDKDTFFFPYDDFKITFTNDKEKRKKEIHVFEKGNWSFTGIKKD